jgi:hypothetical protein
MSEGLTVHPNCGVVGLAALVERSPKTMFGVPEAQMPLIAICIRRYSYGGSQFVS